ncbi:amidohydrolase [Phenylobacterium sp. Root700]|uniref:amidohydrolase n=1 Tax=Phenylobacterium sp. Root700 TaxID=1736591 RepID=UPI0009E71090|nr:amidohydrolase [Phenylobacterium sp. Root700]
MLPAKRALGAGIGLAVALGLMAAAPPSADLIVVNGKVYTADASHKMVSALAVRGNRIVATGTDKEIEKLQGAKTRVINAQGHSVLPGFIDSHVHMLAGAEGLEGPNLSGVRNAAQLQKVVGEFIAAHPELTWIRGGGFYADFTRHDLDPVTGDKPVLLMAGDGHSMLANTKAMKLAGITKDTPSPAGGEIAHDPVTGEPTGVFLETAQSLVQRALPVQTTADLERMVREATDEAHKAGVTTIVNVGHPPELAIYDGMRRRGELKLRIHNALWLTPGSPTEFRPGLGFPDVFTFSEQDADVFEGIRRTYPDNELMTVNMVKIMMDGVIESHTAAMLKPYADEPGVGETNYTPAELNRAISMMDRRGWQIMTHALGDRAVRMALDGYQVAETANPAPARGRRHKIEHMESVDPADIPRFAALGVIASFQTAHAGGMNDPQHRGQRWRYLGYERSAWGFPWKSIKDAGGRLALGSDWPVVSLNPGYAMSVALNRLENKPIPDQKLTLTEILDGYTRDGAYTIFEDKRLGSLEVGKLADVVILADDIFAKPPSSGADLVVDQTIFDGQVVYRRDGVADRK